MGHWGFGIYENDYALDLVDGLIYQSIRTVVYYLYPETHGNTLQHNMPQILGAIEFMVLLCNHVDTIVDITPATAEKWRNTYLTQLQQDHEKYPEQFSKEYVITHSKYANELFDKLVKVCFSI